MNLSSLAWLAVFPALGFLVIVHELGHYWVGRKMGIKIEEFGIGFPPRAKVLFTRKGVPFTLNWLPLGGFVRFAGEESGFDDPDSLLSAPPRRRIPVLIAGVVANMLVAMILFAMIYAIWGVPDNNTTLIASTDEYANSVGFQPNDILVSINGEPIERNQEVLDMVQKSGGKEIDVVIERDGVQQTITAAPRYSESTERYQYGIGLTNNRVSVNILSAIWKGITHTLVMFVEMLVGIGSLIAGLFGSSSASGGVAGPVGISRIVGQVARNGWMEYLTLTGILSVNLAMINLLPIPALDGSRIVFALIEAVRGKKIPPEREAFVHAIGMMFLLGLMVLVTISDVGNIISGDPPISFPTATPVATPVPNITP